MPIEDTLLSAALAAEIHAKGTYLGDLAREILASGEASDGESLVMLAVSETALALGYQKG